MFATSCVYNNDTFELNDQEITDIQDIGNDTIIIDTEAPIIQKSTLNFVSEKTKSLLSKISTSITRSTSEPTVYFLYDETSEKSAYAIKNPNASDSWIFECYGSNTNKSLTIFFEQIEPNKFVTKDTDGKILRHFTYDPEKRELWTYNQTTSRGMSTQDKILCNSMFAAANYLVCEALAVPTGGASLLVGLGFAVASTYICD